MRVLKAFTLTVDTDDIIGTDSDDTFKAPVDQVNTLTTLNSSDNLDGKGGDDKLTVFVDGTVGSVTAAPKIANIETIEIRATAAGTLDLTGATITGLETLSVNNNKGNAVTAVLDDEVTIDLNNAGTGAIAVTFNDSNDETIEISSTSSGNASTAATLTITDAGTAAGATITSLSVVDITGDNYVGLDPTGGIATTANDITTLSFAGSGSLDAGTVLSTALTSVDASNLDDGLTVDVSAATTTALDIKGGAGDDDITADASTKALTVDLGAGDDIIDISGGTGNIGAGDSFAGGEGENTLAIDVADIASVTSNKFSDFQILSLATDTTSALTGTLDFDNYLDSIEQLSIATAATGSLDIDSADGKTINVLTDLGATHNLTINNDTANDEVTVTFDSTLAAIGSGTPSTLTTNGIEDLTVDLTAESGNAVSLGAISVTATDTFELSVADGDSGAAVTLASVTVDSGDALIDISADSVTVSGSIDATGADFLDLNVTGDTFSAATVTTDATDVAIDLSGASNTITAGTFSAVETLEINSAGASNAITTLSAASLVDLTVNVTDGDFATTNAAANTAMETATITGAGDASIVFHAAQTNLTLIDLSDYTGELADDSIDLSATTVGVTVEVGEIVGQDVVGTAGTASGSGDIVLGAANGVMDDVVFEKDFEGSVAIENFESGGDVTDDNIDLSAFNISGGTNDLDFAVDSNGGDALITSATDDFSFEIVLTGVTPGSVNASDFIF